MEEYFKHDDMVHLSTEAPCEDIAMNFLASHTASKRTPSSSENSHLATASVPPLLFKSNLTELHSKVYDGLSQGISSGVWRSKRGDCVQRLLEMFDGRRPVKQSSYYERDEVRKRVYKLPIEGRLDKGWCSDTKGSRICHQP